MPLSPVRILLVDDDTLHLEVFNEWLTSSGFEVTMATDGEKAMALMQPGAFEVAVIDLKMPGISGIDLLELLKACDPALEVIFLTGKGSMRDAIAALRQGRAFDFLLKPVLDLQELNQIIDLALESRRKALLTARLPYSSPLPSYVESLTTRESELLSLLALGWDNMRIALQLNLSEKTVRNALTRIYEKLKVSSRTQAITAYYRFGLFRQDA